MGIGLYTMAGDRTSGHALDGLRHDALNELHVIVAYASLIQMSGCGGHEAELNEMLAAARRLQERLETLGTPAEDRRGA